MDAERAARLASRACRYLVIAISAGFLLASAVTGREAAADVFAGGLAFALGWSAARRPG